MECNIILQNKEFHFISFFQEVGFWSPTLSSATYPRYGFHTNHHEISNCHNKSFLLTTDATKEPRTHLSFTQLRFHCSKNKRCTLHLTTAANSSGEAVVQYFSGQTDANPKACGSFVRMKDDKSKLAADCNQWSNKEWVYPHSGKSRYRNVAFVPWKYTWNLYGS